MLHSIPPSLHYLQDLLIYLEGIPPEYLTEDNHDAIDRIILELQNHLKDIDPGRQATAQESDALILGEWLDQLSPKYPPGEFLLGFMTMLTPDDLAIAKMPGMPAEAVRAGIPSGKILFDLPPGYELVDTKDGWQYRNGDVDLNLRVIDHHQVNPAKTLEPLPNDYLATDPFAPKFEYSTIEFSTVSGTKRRRDTVADYVLQVPGGWVGIGLFANGKKTHAIEKRVEPFFSSIRIVK